MSLPSQHQAFTLSKSRYFTGRRCPKKLYLETFHPELLPDNPAQPSLIAKRGIQLGALARQLYPGGVLINPDDLSFESALAETQRLLLQEDIPALFEPAFAWDNRAVRVDILQRLPNNRFNLIEVKSGTGLKQDYLEDVAYQYQLLVNHGLSIAHVYVMGINVQYVYEGGPYDLEQLFFTMEVTDEAQNLEDDVNEVFEDLQLTLKSGTAPDIAMGKQCKKPDTCVFYQHCRQSEPAYPVYELHRVTPKLLASFESEGIADIRDIPAGFRGVKDKHWFAQSALLSGQPVITSRLKTDLKSIHYPVHFLDFETVQSALPLFTGTRPYQKIPFQWSLHILHANGSLDHYDYLHRDPAEPGKALTEHLVQHVQDQGSIVVYNASFERSVLIQLAKQWPHCAKALMAMMDRLVDLLPIVEQNCYHPEFRGSYSIKSVLPALVPTLGYHDLDIQNGQMAAYGYEALHSPDLSPEEFESLYQALRAYCNRDTLAMVRLYEKLLEMTEGNQ